MDFETVDDIRRIRAAAETLAEEQHTANLIAWVRELPYGDTRKKAIARINERLDL